MAVGWFSVAVILVNGGSFGTTRGVWLVVAVLCLAAVLIGGFRGDYLGVRWGQTDAAMQERVQARHLAQQVTRDALGP